MKGRPCGFTLLEVLIAISIFAVSISIVYGLYSSVISVVQNVEERTVLNGQVQAAFTRIARDLGGLYRPEPGYLRGVDSGDPPEEDPVLEFVSSAHLKFDPAEDPVPLSIVRYYVESEEGDTYALLRSDSPAPIGDADDDSFVDSGGDARRFIVCRGLAEVIISYRDEEGDEQEAWDTTDEDEAEPGDDGRFPAWVDIVLVFQDGSEDEESGTRYSTGFHLRSALIEIAGGSGG